LKALSEWIRRELAFDLSSERLSFSALAVQVGSNILFVPEVITENGVDIRQGKGIKCVNDILGGEAVLETRYDRTERNTGAGDSQRTVLVGCKRDFFLVYLKHLAFPLLSA